MPPVNILVMIHGMSPNVTASSPFAQYEQFWEQVAALRPELPPLIHKRIGIQWGQAMPRLPYEALLAAEGWGYRVPEQPHQLRRDEWLTEAQLNLGARVRTGKTLGEPDKGPGEGQFDLGVPGLRQLVRTLREGIILYGFGDVIYYCSSEGEKNTRRVVYEQILQQLDEFHAEDEVRLHIVAHSLGVTIAHDLLFGLFTRGNESDFWGHQADEASKGMFIRWSTKAQSAPPSLRLGTLVSMASQLPLFVMRKQAMVSMLGQDEYLDPASIGISPDDPRPRWVNFYDVDDLLSFPTRRLYKESTALLELAVDSGDRPDLAHTGYWTNPFVIERAAELLAANCV